MRYAVKPLVFMSALAASGAALAGIETPVNLPLPAPLLLLAVGLGVLYLFRPR